MFVLYIKCTMNVNELCFKIVVPTYWTMHKYANTEYLCAFIIHCLLSVVSIQSKKYEGNSTVFIEQVRIELTEYHIGVTKVQDPIVYH